LLTLPDNGLVVDDPHDAGSLGAAISRMLDPAYRRSASQSAREAAGRWTFEHHYRALLEVFAEVRAAKRAA
jgi:UDP-glucose:(heptosyl)LPS alpha-1,3-glucosyltransferase